MELRVLVTGSNRGLGYQFARQYLHSGNKVIACCREPESREAAKIQALWNEYLTIKKLDVTNFSELGALSKEMTDPIDIVINNAGVYGNRNQTLGSVEPLDMQNVLLTNSIAPVMLAQAFMPHLERGNTKVLVNITSRMGSIADNSSGGSYAYRGSKAALNAMMHSMQIDIRDKGIKILNLHPGWVQTDMGGGSAALTPEDSVKKMCDIIAKAHALEGEFYHPDGYELPW